MAKTIEEVRKQHREHMRKDYRENHEKYLARDRAWKFKNKEKMKESNILRMKQRREEYPWLVCYWNAKWRCTNYDKTHPNYSNKKLLMTKEDFKFLWFRDKASSMKCPSIDRFDNDGDYTLDNCRFIEKVENSRRNSNKPVIQCSLSGEYINSFPSQIRASTETRINQTSISNVLRGKRNHAGGYKWTLVK